MSASQRRGVTRRDFLRDGGALVGGGALVLGIGVTACASDEGPRPSVVNADRDPGPTFSPNAFIRIGSDDSVTLISKCPGP